MPLNAGRDQPHANAASWAFLSSPTKRNTGSSNKSISLRQLNSSSNHDDGLPRYLGFHDDDQMKKNAPYWKSVSKQARRRPRLTFLVVIGLMFLLATLRSRISSTEVAVGVVGSQEATSSSSVEAENTRKPMLDLNPRPVIRKPSGRKDEKYMAYFPHSGYHNQRISLENALAVAKMLDRTLLIPPVWLGHSIPYISFAKLYHRVLEARKIGLEHCKDVLAPAPVPHECLGGYWDYTIVSWDFLVDLERVARQQPVIERWDMSYNWLVEELGLHLEKDMVKIKDSLLYQYRIYDNESDTAPLDKFRERLDISKLKSDYANTRLLHFGTLFGTTRLHLTDKENYKARSIARSSMVFKNEHLDKVSDIIRDRLGGDMAYIGIHLRIGDGVFRDNAARNAEKIFGELCEEKLGLDAELVTRIKNGRVALEPRQARVDGREKNAEGVSQGSEDTAGLSATVRSPTTSAKRKKEDPHSDLPPLPRIALREDSPLHPSLSCRKPLYTNEALLPLNTPIFLATDSSIPDKDPTLKLFFDTFPCISTLSDFSASNPTSINSEPSAAFEELTRLRNKEDGVPLAGFFYPLIDAMVAAKGRDMLGTPGSTFSQFAVDVLHRVYHDWPIVERG